MPDRVGLKTRDFVSNLMVSRHKILRLVVLTMHQKEELTLTVSLRKKLIRGSLIYSKHKGMKKCLNFVVVNGITLNSSP